MNERNGRERVMIFVDLSNIKDRMKVFEKDFIGEGYEDLIDSVTGDRRRTGVYFFDSIPRKGEDAATALHTALRNSKFTVRTRDAYDKRTGTQREVDVAMACEILGQAHKDRYDTAVIVSGDRDFLPVVEEIRRQGKRAEVACFFTKTSKKLLENCDVFFNLKMIMAGRTKVKKVKGKGSAEIRPYKFRDAGAAAAAAWSEQQELDITMSGRDDARRGTDNEWQRPVSVPGIKGQVCPSFFGLRARFGKVSENRHENKETIGKHRVWPRSWQYQLRRQRCRN